MTEARASHLPEPWIAWGRHQGSPVLQRSMRDGYPFNKRLLRELRDYLCPKLEGMERDVDLREQVAVGRERDPNELSFENLDRISAHLRSVVVPGAGLGTEIKVGRVRRAELARVTAAGRIYASSVTVSVFFQTKPEGVDVTYLWARSDQP